VLDPFLHLVGATRLEAQMRERVGLYAVVPLQAVGEPPAEARQVLLEHAGDDGCLDRPRAQPVAAHHLDEVRSLGRRVGARFTQLALGRAERGEHAPPARIGVRGRILERLVELQEQLLAVLRIDLRHLGGEGIARRAGHRRIEREQQFLEAGLRQLAVERGLPERVLEDAVFGLSGIEKQ